MLDKIEQMLVTCYLLVSWSTIGNQRDWQNEDETKKELHCVCLSGRFITDKFNFRSKQLILQYSELNVFTRNCPLFIYWQLLFSSFVTPNKEIKKPLPDRLLVWVWLGILPNLHYTLTGMMLSSNYFSTLHLKLVALHSAASKKMFRRTPHLIMLYHHVFSQPLYEVNQFVDVSWTFYFIFYQWFNSWMNKKMSKIYPSGNPLRLH